MINFKKDKKDKIQNEKNSVYKNRKFLTDEIANIKNVEGMYTLLKKLPNPDVVLRKTGKSIETLRLIESDGQVSTCITSRVSGVTSLKYRIKHDVEEQKEFYESILKNLSMDNVVRAILNAPKYGYQPIEIIWDLDDNKRIIPKDMVAKPPEWFFYGGEDRLLRFRAKGNSDGLVISDDMKKFICPRNNATYDNPYGEGYLSKCFWDTVFKKGSKEFWIKFAERYGLPWLIGKYERGASDKEIDDLLNALEAMIQDAVAAFPDNSMIEIKETSGKSASTEVFKGLIEICDKDIAKNILGQTLTTDVGTSGSYSLGEVHMQVRSDIINSDKKLVEESINKVLRWTHELNYGDRDYPEFELYREEEIDQARADRDTKVYNMGVRFTKEYFKKTYGYDDEDITIAEDNNNNNGNNFSESEREDNDFNAQKELDNFIDTFSDARLNDILSEKIEPVIRHLRSWRYCILKKTVSHWKIH